MDEVLQKLKRGVRQFQTDIFPGKAEFYAQAASQRQEPHTLFITCADSRIDPLAITSAAPGEVFVTRNIGNMVPAYGEMLGGVSAVIEFAVSGLKVRHIVVCGHTQCGAMNALLAPDSVESMPTVKSWLRNAHAALGVAHKSHPQSVGESSAQTPVERLTQQNVLLQMQHLKTHPSVAQAIASDDLTISGWVYNIGTGEIKIAEGDSPVFERVGPPAGPSDPAGP